MSSTSRRRERTITVETGELGPVRVRRISLGGMARIAERLRAEGVHDEAALGEALVAEVVVSSLDEEGGSETAPRAADPFDTARLALLSEDDRRSIAAAVLTLEGVKAAGEGVLEDPRRTLARRYSHVLDTQRHAPGDGAQRAAQPEDVAQEAAPAQTPPEVPQFALFEGLAPPLSPAAAGAGTGPGEGARATPAARAPGAWERERARLEADVADLEALLAQQAEQREALEAGAAAAVDRERGAIRSARRYRWLAAALLALLVVGVGAQFAWIGMLRRDAAQQRAQFDSELRTQRQALEQAQRAAAEASARVQQLEARRGAAPATAKSAGARSATANPTAGKAASASAARPPASTSKASASKSPAESKRKP